MKIRQDRFVPNDTLLHIRIASRKFKVLDFSFYGVSVEASDIDEMELKKDSCRAEILLDKIFIQEIFLKRIREEKKIGFSKCSFEVVQGIIEVDKICGFIEASKLYNALSNQFNLYSNLPSPIKSIIYDLKNKLIKIRILLKEKEKEKDFVSLSEKVNFDTVFISVFAPYIKDLLVDSNASLHELFLRLSKSDQKKFFMFFREQLHFLISRSSFAKRSQSKLRGYAGDYEVISMIYRNENLGRDLFDKCMDKAIQLHPEPDAVRNRVIYLSDHIFSSIKEGKDEINILSVACGPAKEIVLALKLLKVLTVPKKVTFVLQDQDVSALKDAEREIRPCLKDVPHQIDIVLSDQSMKSILTNGIASHLRFNLIYSAGVFDYFSDYLAQRALKMLSLALADKGKIVVGNFDANSPNQFSMLTLLDWHLVLRSAEQMMKVFALPGYKMNIEKERHGINNFCIITE